MRGLMLKRSCFRMKTTGKKVITHKKWKAKGLSCMQRKRIAMQPTPATRYVQPQFPLWLCFWVHAKGKRK